jgi:predicted naringenin-chalcone synthase
MFLSRFLSLRPPFETAQAETLEWLVDAHTQAEKTKGMEESQLALFRAALREKLWHVGCKPDRIEKRGHVLADFLHRNWEKMEIYPLALLPQGCDLSIRSRYFEQFVDKIFQEYYPEESSAPDDLIHVSCTGYAAPSGAQKIVSKRNWGAHTTVTHAYHMGCYGSLPALRMALGFIHSGKAQADIVHTELCSLHSNPSLHGLDQLVSQSLFADGFMRYTLSPSAQNPSLKICALLEEIIPNSAQAMSWNVSDWGFQMTLARELPVLIARALRGYLERLCHRGKISIESIFEKALFAIHPGGPKILLNIQEMFHLSSAQMHYSFQILRLFGNMSSATLPHIWEAILKDQDVQDQTMIVSLAFGPGLTISGALMEKICGS